MFSCFIARTYNTELVAGTQWPGFCGRAHPLWGPMYQTLCFEQ